MKDLEALGKKFDQISGYARTDEGGLVTTGTYNTPNQISGHIRYKGEYSGGIHNIHLKIEQYKTIA